MAEIAPEKDRGTGQTIASKKSSAGGAFPVALRSLRSRSAM
jgi:hypothetical protein